MRPPNGTSPIGVAFASGRVPLGRGTVNKRFAEILEVYLARGMKPPLGLTKPINIMVVDQTGDTRLVTIEAGGLRYD